jgi:hypothetical protein
VRTVTIKSYEFPGKTEQVYQGGLACGDTSTGKVAKGFVSTTLIPLGLFVEDQNTASGGTVLVELFREVRATWFANGDSIDATSVFSEAFVLDDQTVTKSSNTNTRSVAGHILAVDSKKGVLVAHDLVTPVAVA